MQIVNYWELRNQGRVFRKPSQESTRRSAPYRGRDLRGYCDETGDPIGRSRLEARPIGLCRFEAQEMPWREGRLYGWLSQTRICFNVLEVRRFGLTSASI